VVRSNIRCLLVTNRPPSHPSLTSYSVCADDALKHLIYLIDGTWLFCGALTLENAHSNVFNLTDRLAYFDSTKNQNSQIAHYVRGIGSTKGLRKISSGGFSFAIDETIQDIYINICTNFNSGDKIYLVGFSRGAIIARAVSELLDFGLLNSSSVNLIDDLWKHFRKSQTDRSRSDQDAPSKISILSALEKIGERHFNSNFANVEFLGLFDSVIGGAGIWKSAQYLNKISRFSPRCVLHTVQLLAIDETRRMFPPEPFSGKRQGEGISSRTLEQIWMPGVHADVGGGYDNSILSDLSMMVMIDRMQYWTELSFDVSDLEEKYLGKGKLRPKVHNEYASSRWAWSFPFKKNRRPRIPLSRVHPIVDEMSEVKTTYKGSIPRNYDASRFGDVPRSDYFISASWKDQRISW